MANIKQVAARAGLSVACVSKYLKNPDSVLPSSRQQIEEAIRDLRYVPSRTARSLRTKRSYTVKVILGSIINPFYAELFETLRLMLDTRGYAAVLHPLDRPLAPGDADGVDGILVGFANDERQLASIAACAGGTPVVCLHWQALSSPLPCVWTDVRQGIRLAARHLLTAVCRHFAYIGGPEADAISVRKLQGVRAELEGAGLTLPGEWRHHGPFTFQSGYDASKRLCRDGVWPDGILCENDVLAAGVICGLLRQGIRVPERIRVTGFDNIPLANMYTPALTSVALPIDSLCREAVAMLFQLLAGQAADTRSFPPELIVRQS